MIRKVFKTILNLFVEALSFIVLIAVLVVSCVVLVCTGKFEAFGIR